MNYISDLYPTYIPPISNSYLSYSHNIEQSELNTYCTKLHKQINKILSKPHCYIHTADVLIPNLLYESCVIQHTFKHLPNEYLVFILNVRTACHTVLLLSMLATVATGKQYEERAITTQVESLWKAANSVNNHMLLEYCSNVSKVQLIYRDIKEEWYRKLLSCIQPVRFVAVLNSKVEKRNADITYPTGDVAVSECDILTIRGVGDDSLHCIIEYPDGTLESAACEMFGQQISAYIRVHKPISMVNVSSCIAVVYNTADVTNGQGLNETYWKCKSFVPISSKIEIVIKQKVS
jgi:hypothetical protein